MCVKHSPVLGTQCLVNRCYVLKDICFIPSISYMYVFLSHSCPSSISFLSPFLSLTDLDIIVGYLSTQMLSLVYLAISS